MLIELGFKSNNSESTFPIINIVFNKIYLGKNIILDQCGKIDDRSAKFQTLRFDVEVDRDLTQTHILEVHAINIKKNLKIFNDFGIQICFIKLDEIDLEWFFKDAITYNPIIGQGYINQYLIPNQRCHEIEIINSKQMHVVRGDYANYINMPHGKFELKFQTPLYSFFLQKDFGKMTRSHIMTF